MEGTSPNIDMLRNLYRDSRVAHAFLDLAARRERDRSETKVDSIWRLLGGEGQAFERREIIALFRQLEKAGCGQFVEGRRGWPSRFVWSVGLTGVGRAAAGDAQPIAQILSDESGSPQGDDGKATISQLEPIDDEEGVEELGETGGTGLEEEIEPDDGGFASEITQPFDPAKIRVETKPMSIQLLLDRIRHKEIDLAPGFQRKGGIWTTTAKSRLIESLLIRIPLPAFYMDGSDEGRWLVVDGLQRLSTLESFTLDKTLRLNGLEFLEDYNGKTFDKLPRNLQRRILETQVTVFLIQENTPPEVKFTIFRRINTGGLPLSGQEIRHALNQGKASVLLQTLAESPEFKTATSDGIRDERMGDRECVLRLLAFMSTSYDGLSTPKLSCSSGPTNGRPERAASGVCVCPLSLISVNLRNGPEQSRARGLCAAKRTLDGEDRSGTWGRRESGPGVSGGVPLAEIRGSAPSTLPRALSARGIK